MKFAIMKKYRPHHYYWVMTCILYVVPIYKFKYNI